MEVFFPTIIPNLKTLIFSIGSSKPVKGTAVIDEGVHESGYRVTSFVRCAGPVRMENGSARYPYPVQISEKKNEHSHLLNNSLSVRTKRSPLNHVTDSRKHDTGPNYYILDISECGIP